MPPSADEAVSVGAQQSHAASSLTAWPGSAGAIGHSVGHCV